MPKLLSIWTVIGWSQSSVATVQAVVADEAGNILATGETVASENLEAQKGVAFEMGIDFDAANGVEYRAGFRFVNGHGPVREKINGVWVPLDPPYPPLLNVGTGSGKVGGGGCRDGMERTGISR